MAKSKDAGDAKGGKGKLVPAVVLAIGLIGGGYFMGGGKSKAVAPAAAAGEAATTTTLAAPGEILALDSITLNLADNRLLKVGIALQLAKTAKTEEMKNEAPKALDEAITLLGGRSFADLSSPAGRAAAKEELSKKITEAYEGKVLGIYFTEFVMQ